MRLFQSQKLHEYRKQKLTFRITGNKKYTQHVDYKSRIREGVVMNNYINYFHMYHIFLDVVNLIRD